MPETRARATPFIGVSLKMYFSHAQTIRWCRDVAELARANAGVASSRLDLAVLPGFLSLREAVTLLSPSHVSVGAQDLAWADTGAFTGEVSGEELREIGCSYVEVGHAERRTLFHESDDTIQRKVAAAWRNDLVPIVCVGEDALMPAAEAAQRCIRQLESAMASQATSGGRAPVVVAYEPIWAIGAPTPAPVEHIRQVCRAIADWLAAAKPAAADRVIYGGSAGVGLLPSIWDDVDGLFLGRFAHDPSALASILDEAGG